MHRFPGLCAAFLMLCAAPLVHAEGQPELAVAVDVRHVAKDPGPAFPMEEMRRSLFPAKITKPAQAEQ